MARYYINIQVQSNMPENNVKIHIVPTATQLPLCNVTHAPLGLPGHFPSDAVGTLGAVDVVVWMPDASVMMSVASVVGGSTFRIAVAFVRVASPVPLPEACLSKGEYVLTPRSDWPSETCPAVGRGVAEVLKIYIGVVYEGVGRRTAGAVVAIVAESDEKADESEAGVSVSDVVLNRG